MKNIYGQKDSISITCWTYCNTKGVRIQMKYLTLQQEKKLMSILQNAKPWMNPQQLREQVILCMKREHIFCKKVQVQGNVKQAKIIIIFNDMTMWVADKNMGSWTKMNIDSKDSDYIQYSSPKVVLVNLCDVTLRPVPRLNLSTAVIASYLRKKHVAEVTIIDMQMGVTITEVVDICKKIDPALIGMSVDFKEYDLAEQLLMEFKNQNVECTKVLGNILPSLLFDEFLNNHPDILISYGEGENSWYDLAMWKSGKLPFHKISGLRHLERGKLRTTPIRYIDMKDCQTPALDTLPELAKHGGILTLETSRGSLVVNGGQPPLHREHRLYQADWLLRYYGFTAGEILSESRPFFNTYLDPKCDWALGHMEYFPVEINTASYNTLLRVPGIGTKSAGRIVNARKTGKLDFASLKKMGVVLKRAIYFITCNGRMMYDFLKVEEDYITRNLVSGETDVVKGFGDSITYKQLTLFDDFQLGHI